jgi:hypothetical protein
MRGQAVGPASNLLRTDAKKICDARLVFVPRSGMDSAKSLSSRTTNAAAKVSPNPAAGRRQPGKRAGNGFDRAARGIDRRREIFD